MVRPRAASPGVAVSRAGMVSPTQVIGAAVATDGAASAACAASATASPNPSLASADFLRTGGLPAQALRLFAFNGRSRMRLPVAAKIAFSTAGAATAIVGSPTPPQKPPDGITIVSTLGIASIFIGG